MSEFVPFLKGDFDARQHKIYNLPEGVDPSDAATVSQLGSGGGGVPFVGVDPPDDPTDGMLWWDPDDDTPSGGSQSVKHVVVPVGFADIDPQTALADLYLLPENESLLLSWPVMLEAFNGRLDGDLPMSGHAFGPTGEAGGAAISDQFDPTTTSAANAADGIIGSDPSSAPGNTTTTMVPMAAPVPGGGAVQLTIDFGSPSVPMDSVGTTGQLEYHLVIAVAS